MDIAALSMAMSQNQVMESVGVAMLSKSLDTQEMVGNEVLNLLDASAMELSVNPNIGSNIDLSI